MAETAALTGSGEGVAPPCLKLCGNCKLPFVKGEVDLAVDEASVRHGYGHVVVGIGQVDDERRRAGVEAHYNIAADGFDFQQASLDALTRVEDGILTCDGPVPKWRYFQGLVKMCGAVPEGMDILK